MTKGIDQMLHTFISLQNIVFRFFRLPGEKNVAVYLISKFDVVLFIFLIKDNQTNAG